MKTLLLVVFCVILILFDSYVTFRRIEEFGPDVELNPVIRGMSRKLGAFAGSLFGLVLPNFLLVASLTVFHLDLGLAFLAGLRTMLSVLQIKSYASSPKSIRYQR